MTDKQIIIDGVDVSGCPDYQTIGYLSQKDEGIEDYCNLFVYSCKNANCHYKKWQRKEQECENNKIAHQMELDIYNQECLNLQEELKAKEQEIKKLKSDNLQEIGQLKFAIGTLTAENLHLKELLDMRIEAICDSCMAGSMLPINCRIYKQRLLNIKQILTEGVCKNCSEDSANNCIPECDTQKILQIISEVEDAK